MRLRITLLLIPELSDSFVFKFVTVTKRVDGFSVNSVGDSANRPTTAQFRFYLFSKKRKFTLPLVLESRM